PVPRALALLVRAVGALGDQPLESLRLRDLEQRVAVVEVLGEGDRRDALVEQLPQLRLALGQRQVEERLTVELEQVEGVEDERAGALLQLREARPARRGDSGRLAGEA